MQRLSNKLYPQRAVYPEKVLQFGEGNFLRAFVDWHIQVMNEKADFNGSVVVVHPRGAEKMERLNRQDGLFTLYLQGMKDGEPVNEHMVIDTISRGIDLYAYYDQYVKLAGTEELRFIVSNTTEAGIVFHPEDFLEGRPPSNFPGKLTAFLYHRFQAFAGDENRGCIIIPCELIENNGEVLKQTVLQYARHWNLDFAFIDWVQRANTFCSSLVDRIVPGFPRDSIQDKTEELGYQDDLLVVGEQYHLWVIEGPAWIKDELPVAGTGLNIRIVDDLTPYRTRKVRILNGAHTAMTPVAYLSGLDTVEQAVNDPEVGRFITEMIKEEILPTLDGSPEELTSFVNEVIHRFANPYIQHYLLSISLNSISKFKTRDLPTLLEYVRRTGDLPKRLVFSFSCLLYFYRGKRGDEEIVLQDDAEIVELFQGLWRQWERGELGIHAFAQSVLAAELLWGTDLTVIPNLAEAVAANLVRIEQGVRDALEVCGTVTKQGGA